MIILPLPFIRSIGIGGMLIPAVSVLAAITLLPALLYILGPRINSVRVMPRRFVEGSDDPEHGFWGRWATSSRGARRRSAMVGIAIVGVLLFSGLAAQPGRRPGQGPARRAATRTPGLEALADAGHHAGRARAVQIVVEGQRRRRSSLEAGGRQLDRRPGDRGRGRAARPRGRSGVALVEAFSASTAPRKETRRRRSTASGRRPAGRGRRSSAATPRSRSPAAAPEQRDFVARGLRQLPVRARSSSSC